MQTNNSLATNVPPPIRLKLSARRRHAANYCAAQRGKFRTRSTFEAAMFAQRISRTLKLRRGFLLHPDRAREEQVVLQVNVLMQISLEISQRLVQSLEEFHKLSARPSDPSFRTWL